MDDETTDENPMVLEQRPFSNPDNKKKTKQQKKADLNKDLPLQRNASSGSRAGASSA